VTGWGGGDEAGAAEGDAEAEAEALGVGLWLAVLFVPPVGEPLHDAAMTAATIRVSALLGAGT
jgi:hypothetical protein